MMMTPLMSRRSSVRALASSAASSPSIGRTLCERSSSVRLGHGPLRASTNAGCSAAEPGSGPDAEHSPSHEFRMSSEATPPRGKHVQKEYTASESKRLTACQCSGLRKTERKPRLTLLHAPARSSQFSVQLVNAPTRSSSARAVNISPSSSSDSRTRSRAVGSCSSSSSCRVVVVVVVPVVSSCMLQPFAAANSRARQLAQDSLSS